MGSFSLGTVLRCWPLVHALGSSFGWEAAGPRARCAEALEAELREARALRGDALARGSAMRRGVLLCWCEGVLRERLRAEGSREARERLQWMVEWLEGARGLALGRQTAAEGRTAGREDDEGGLDDYGEDTPVVVATLRFVVRSPHCPPAVAAACVRLLSRHLGLEALVGLMLSGVGVDDDEASLDWDAGWCAAAHRNALRAAAAVGGVEYLRDAVHLRDLLPLASKVAVAASAPLRQPLATPTRDDVHRLHRELAERPDLAQRVLLRQASRLACAVGATAHVRAYATRSDLRYAAPGALALTPAELRCQWLCLFLCKTVFGGGSREVSRGVAEDCAPELADAAAHLLGVSQGNDTYVLYRLVHTLLQSLLCDICPGGPASPLRKRSPSPTKAKAYAGSDGDEDEGDDPGATPAPVIRVRRLNREGQALEELERVIEHAESAEGRTATHFSPLRLLEVKERAARATGAAVAGGVKTEWSQGRRSSVVGEFLMEVEPTTYADHHAARLSHAAELAASAEAAAAAAAAAAAPKATTRPTFSFA